jgi:hypothetical protein
MPVTRGGENNDAGTLKWLGVLGKTKLAVKWRCQVEVIKWRLYQPITSTTLTDKEAAALRDSRSAIALPRL